MAEGVDNSLSIQSVDPAEVSLLLWSSRNSLKTQTRPRFPVNP